MSADDHARRLLDQAAQLQQQGRLDQAAELCRTLLAAQPRHGGALHLLGVIAFHKGDLDGARACLADEIGRAHV